MKYTDGKKLGDVVNTEMDRTVIPQKKEMALRAGVISMERKKQYEIQGHALMYQPQEFILHCRRSSVRLDRRTNRPFNH